MYYNLKILQLLERVYLLWKYLFIYLFIVLRFQTSYNNCIKEAGIPQQLNINIYILNECIYFE